jgi:uncharacterized membrane protein
MEERIREGDFENAVIWGVRTVGEQLRAHFPGDRGPSNELSDRPVVL